MIPSIFNSTTIPIVQQVVDFAQARHNVLAGNIANLDVPGYRVRDLSVDTFQARLSEAIEVRDQLRQDVTPGVVTGQPGDAMRKVKESMQSILYHDGSDVGIEQQIAEISKNQAMHNTAISILTHQFHLLQAAIGERV